MMNKRIALLLGLAMLCLALPAMAEEATEPVYFAPFEAENLNGEGTVTQTAFEDARITLVNFWTTWCGPCVSELPELATLSDRTGGDLQVVSVLLDGLDQSGQRDESAIEAMRLLAEDSGVGYPVLLPDAFLSAVGTMVTAVPTTFIVDAQGELLDLVVGSNTADGWLQIAQEAANAAYGNVTLQK